MTWMSVSTGLNWFTIDRVGTVGRPVSHEKDQLKEKAARILELEEQNHSNELERDGNRQQMQSIVKNNFGLKKENEGLKKENEGLKNEQEELKKEVQELKKEIEALKKKNEALLSAKNQKILESPLVPESPEILDSPEPLIQPPTSFLDSPPPLLEPHLTQTPTQQETDRVRQFYRERSPEISDPLLVSDSESDDANEEPDVEFAPNSSNQSKNEKARRKKQVKAKERAKKLMDSALAQPKPWKCQTCSATFLNSTELRQHVLAYHKEQKHFCNRCPSSGSSSEVKKHQQAHFRNDVKFKNKPEGRECTLCRIWFGSNGHLLFHLRKYHLPKNS